MLLRMLVDMRTRLRDSVKGTREVIVGRQLSLWLLRHFWMHCSCLGVTRLVERSDLPRRKLMRFKRNRRELVYKHDWHPSGFHESILSRRIIENFYVKT